MVQQATIEGEKFSMENARLNNRAAMSYFDDMLSALFEAKGEAKQLDEIWHPLTGVHPSYRPSGEEHAYDNFVNNTTKAELWNAIVWLSMALGHLSGDYTLSETTLRTLDSLDGLQFAEEAIRRAAEASVKDYP